MDVIALQAVIAGNCIGTDLLERVTLVRISGRVIDSGSKEILSQLPIAWRV
jgi:hypothetical protein